MFKLVCLIWLLVLSSFAALATSAGTAGIPICTVPFPQPAGTLRFDYDCGIQTHIGYDSQCVASIVLKSDPRIAACGFDGTKMQPTGETRFKIARLTAFSAIISKFLAVESAEAGNIMSKDQQTYVTFTDISGMSDSEAKGVLQLKNQPSHYATFDTLQIIDDLSIPGGQWGASPIPEPITSTFPGYGIGGATQATTKTPILNYTLQPFSK